MSTETAELIIDTSRIQSVTQPDVFEQKQTVRDTYQTIAAEYDERIPGCTKNDDRFTEGERGFILDGILPTDRVLDMGCGTGRFTLPLAQRALSVTALDLSPAMLGVAAGKAREQGLEITFREGDMTALPFEDGSFDVVTCMLALMHVPVAEQQSVFREVARVLAPGGRFLVAVKNRLFEQMTPIDRFAAIDITDTVREELIFTNTRGDEDLVAPWHAFSPRDLHRLSALAGLSVVEVRGNTPIAAWLSDEVLKDPRVYGVVSSLENLLGRIPPLNYLGYHLMLEAVKPLA
jgi:ubiquinone/menaquinone biosynthesis C-methylase UbiE